MPRIGRRAGSKAIGFFRTEVRGQQVAADPRDEGIEEVVVSVGGVAKLGPYAVRITSVEKMALNAGCG
jgi:hypothetical protein